jgi:hypothetical protein
MSDDPKSGKEFNRWMDFAVLLFVVAAALVYFLWARL